MAIINISAAPLRLAAVWLIRPSPFFLANQTPQTFVR